tara:strand:+ start:27575 stop:30265 length:2691 start_codon:yes stop_codon:yes gene_type:complete
MTNVTWKKIFVTIMVFLAMIAVPAYAAANARVVSLTSEPAPMYVGDSATLTVQVDNAGDEPAIDAVVTYEILLDSNVVSSGSDTVSLGISEVQNVEFAWSPTESGTYDTNTNITLGGDTDTETLEITVEDKLEFTSFDVTETVTTNELLYSTQPITFSGAIEKNGAGVAKTITFNIESIGVIGSTTSAADGTFSYTHSTGIQFATPTDKTVTATFYEDAEAVSDTDTFELDVGEATGDGLVDMTITPGKLVMDPGALFDYIISVKSVGDVSGTYKLEISTHHEFEYWLSTEVNYVTLAAGGQDDISLFVDVPNNAYPGEYQISVKLEDMNDRLVDIEKVYLEINDIGQVDYFYDDDDNEDRDEYDVNVNIEPRTLNVKAGSYSEYDILIQNLGTRTDTYELDLRVGWSIDHWFDFEDEEITIKPGKYKYVSLYVDIPIDAVVDSYPVKITVEGDASDVEKADLVIDPPEHYYDLSLDTPTVVPSGFTAGAASVVEVSASVELTDLKSGGGRYVNLKMYVDDTYMQSEQVYIASGQAKDIKFTLDATKGPINGDVGEYEIYYTASIAGEYEKSRKATLKIRDLASPSVSLDPEVFELIEEDTIEMTMQVYNPTFESQTYQIYSKGIEIAFTPDTITVLPEETKKIAITGVLQNAPDGETAVDVYISNANAEEFTTIQLNVGSDEADNTDTGSVEGGGLTGYILTTAGGITSVIIALLLLVAVVGYYYYSRQDEEVLEGIDDQGNETLSFGSGGDQPPAGFGGAFANLKKVFKDKVLSKPANAERTEVMKTEKRQGINLDRLVETPKSTEVASPQQSQPSWHPKDAEHILANLEGIKQEFHQTYENARDLKKKLHNFADSVGHKAQEVQKHIEPTEQVKEQTKPVAGNGYIKSIIENV